VDAADDVARWLLFLFDRFLLQKCIYGIKKGVEFFFDDAPYDAIVNGVITVNKDVPEGDDVTVLGDLLQEFWLVTLDPIEGLSDNFELPFYPASKQFVRGVVIECAAGYKSLDGPSGPKDVVQVGKKVILHK